MKSSIFFFLIMSLNFVRAQNIGIGVNNPTEKLEISGKLKSDGMTISTGGSPYDFLSIGNANGDVAFKKGHGGMGLGYIICIDGIFPNRTGQPLTSGPFVGQVALFAGNFTPAHWMSCNGQELKIDDYTALYSLLLHTYGGTDSTFLLPDLRGRAVVGPGNSVAGYSWTRGQTSQ